MEIAQDVFIGSRDWPPAKLTRLGDAVVITNVHGRVTFLNPVAQALTGWTHAQAVGQALERIFRIVSEATRVEVKNPVLQALSEGTTVELSSHTLLISRDGTASPIEGSVTAIRNDQGEATGVVLVFFDTTARKAADLERQRFVSLADNSFDFVGMCGMDLMPCYVNRAGLKMMGFDSLEQACTTPVREFFFPEDQDRAINDFLPSVLKKGIGQTEIRFRHFKTGEVIWMLYSVWIVADRGGEPVGMATVSRNITEHKLAEQNLRESEERFRTLADNISQLAWMADASGWIYWYNRRWFEYTGTTLEAMQGWGWKQVHHPDHVERVVRRIQQSWDTGEAWEDTFPLRGTGGQYRWFLSRALPIRDASGLIVRWLGTNTDITELRAAQQALGDSEGRFRRMFQSAPDGILILDSQTGRILDANAYVAALVGREPDDLLGKQLDEIGLFQDIEGTKQAIRELREIGYLRYEHLLIQNQRGEVVPVEFVSNVYYQDQRPLARCHIRDISERRRLERQIALQADALVDESRRKDEFLAMLSHELRNPLAPIRAAMQLLKLEERGGENLIQRQALEVIERQFANLTKLISDLLEVSRVVSGRIRLHQQTVDLNQVVRHALETAQPLVEQRRHELLVNVGVEPVWASADATRLEEVFVNLLDNAAKYTDPEGRIEVWCERVGGMNQAQVRVRDNGVGIDERLLLQIFDLFAQADRSLDRAAGGLGIGLSLAQRLVAMHGGSIEAHSPPVGQSRGSEFVVRLPLLTTPEQRPPQTAVAEPKKPTGARVLVVDDSHDLVLMLGRTLRHLGYSVQSAHTGPDGLAAAVQWRPDIVLLDIGLPGLDGYEVARRLRSDPLVGNGGERMRLIALTGYGQLTDIAQAREAGFDAHLTKPYELVELEELLRTHGHQPGCDQQ